jgi:hypothetical protein
MADRGLEMLVPIDFYQRTFFDRLAEDMTTNYLIWRAT